MTRRSIIGASVNAIHGLTSVKALRHAHGGQPLTDLPEAFERAAAINLVEQDIPGTQCTHPLQNDKTRWPGGLPLRGQHSSAWAAWLKRGGDAS